MAPLFSGRVPRRRSRQGLAAAVVALPRMWLASAAVTAASRMDGCWGTPDRMDSQPMSVPFPSGTSAARRSAA